MASTKQYWLAVAFVFASIGSVSAVHHPDRGRFVSVGSETRPPIGWVEFCAAGGEDCSVDESDPRDVVLTSRAWKELNRINRSVNTTIRPMTDMDLYGVVEKWTYPDNGKGDCEDYVLLKRRMLMQAGFPREALLITVVRDKRGEGHAVLTVKTDRGEYILDNQAEEILLWSDTGYRFVKRQSQSDPNRWVSLSTSRPVGDTAASR